ncbi:hypothetical protein Tco_0290750 [Tanacetum coccineum]
MRNMINLHTSRNDSLLGTLKFVSKTEDCHRYGALIPNGMINQDIKDSKAYKTYYNFATGKVPPKKVRKFKKPASPKYTTIPASPKESTMKSKRVKSPVKKSTTAPIVGVVIRDTPDVSVSKKKAPAKAVRGKGIELLSDAALLEDAQLKKALQKSRQETHKLQASGSSEGADFESEVPDESKAKSSDTSERTGVKLGVLDVSTADSSKSSKNDDDDGNDAQDSERTNSNEKENPNLNLTFDEEEEIHDEEYEHNPDDYVPIDEETDDENEEFNDEEYDELYKDMNVRSNVAEHEEVRKGDVEMTDATCESGSQEKSYEQVVEDAYVTITTSQKTKGSKQSSSTSFDFASKFLILDHVPPVVDEVASLMNIKVHQEDSSTQPPPLLSVPVMAILKTSSVPATTIPLTIIMITHLPQPTTPSPAPTTELSQLKQADYPAQLLESVKSQVPTIVDDLLIKDIIKDEVKSQLPQILPKEVSNFTTPVIQSTIADSLENRSESYKVAPEHKDLYDALVKSYKLDKDLFEFYGNTYSLKRGHDDKDQDEDPPAGSDQGLKKQKTSKDTEPFKDTKMQQDQGSEFGHTDDQPDVEAAPKHDWFKKPNKPPTPDRAWNKSKSIEFRPPRTWISVEII